MLPLVALALLACRPEEAAADPAAGLLGDGPLNPFPNAGLVVDGEVTIPAALVPAAETPFDTERLRVRGGFSPVQPAVVLLPVRLDPASVGGQASLGLGGAVRMVDLDSGTEIACFAELDAHPDVVDAPERQALLVRPQVAMPVGHRVAVVLTSALRDAAGAPLVLEEWAAAKASDPAVAALDDTLSGLGYSDVALAWDFPVGDGGALTRDLAAQVGVPATWTFDEVRDVDVDADDVPAGVWRQAEGTFTVPNWLEDDRRFVIGASGPAAQGTAEATLYVHIPGAARTAAPGSVPVLVFGHGILSKPSRYLESEDDASNLIALAERLPAIVVATTWRGLTFADQADTVEAAGDIGRFPEITDRLTQGVANTVGLVRLVTEGALLDDPIFEGKADPTRTYWYGISLGGIEGAVTLANQDGIDHAVLHVGGSAWTTMLERSSNWPPFELLVRQDLPDPYDRQLAYALLQLYWDPVDPAAHAEALRGRSILWQESIGDEQVPNITTELLLRSVGAPIAGPNVTTPWGVELVDLPARGPIATQFDPQVALPGEENRPAVRTGAHDLPRTWDGALAQTLRFFDASDPGSVEHFCGGEACSADNPGSLP